MLKFMVVLYRKPGTTRGQFRDYLRNMHGPMAEAIPGLLKYVQNHVAEDSTRRDPGWDAIVELSWADREAMEAGWRTAEGRAATADLEVFTDLSRVTWSIVDADARR